MFKPEKSRRKNTVLIAGQEPSDAANFRSNSISVSTKSRIKESFLQIEEISGIPAPGNQFRIITIRAIVTFDFILAILKAELIQELHIAIYRIGKKTLAELLSLHKSGSIGSIFFLINNGIPKMVPGVYEILMKHVSPDWRVKVEHTHTKIILAKTQDNHYVVEGSGNMSKNGQFEQYIFENNKPVYDFHREWMEKL